MKILVLSDTHGYNENMWRAMEIESPFDVTVHCGDFGEYLDDIRYNADCPVYAVRGNNDYFSDAPREELFEVSNKKVLLLHGDRDGVYGGYDRIIYKGLEKGADIIMFGHTHIPYIDKQEGIILVNPGSLTYPRQDRHIPTYAVVEILDNGKINAELKYLY